MELPSLYVVPLQATHDNFDGKYAKDTFLDLILTSIPCLVMINILLQAFPKLVMRS